VTPFPQLAEACLESLPCSSQGLGVFWWLWFAGPGLGFLGNTGTGLLSLLLKWKQKEELCTLLSKETSDWISLKGTWI